MKTTHLTVLLCLAFPLCVTGGRNLVKRQAHFPGLGLPHFPFMDNFHPHPSDPPTTYNHAPLGNFYHNFYDSHVGFPTFAPHPTHPNIPPQQNLCVHPPDLSAMYNITSIVTGYPSIEISTERTQRPNLAILIPSAPIPAPVPYPVDSSYSCPSQMARLLGFRKYSARCWVLQDVHAIRFAKCTQPYCQGCSYANTRRMRNMCWNHYETVRAWAYCEGNPSPAGKIAREMLVIPKYCACKMVRCY